LPTTVKAHFLLQMVKTDYDFVSVNDICNVNTGINNKNK